MNFYYCHDEFITHPKLFQAVYRERKKILKKIKRKNKLLRKKVKK